MEKTSNSKIILTVCKAVFGVLAVGFIVWYFAKNWQEFSATLANVNIGIFPAKKA